MGNFQLDEAQYALRDEVTRFAAERIAPYALEWDRDIIFPVDALREAAGLGMGAMFCREQYGGGEMSRLDGVLAFESLARGCPTVSAYISIHNLVAWMIDRFGDDVQRGRFVPELASMAIFGAYCLTEPSCGSDAAALKTSAALDGDGWILNGVKQFISGAGEAGIYVVMARDMTMEGAISSFLVEGDAPGLSFGALERKMGWNAQPTRAVYFENCRIPAANRLGEAGSGFRYAMQGLDGGRLNIAACSLGGGAFALDCATDYMGERKAFGRPIGDFQALQFRRAEALIDLEQARSLLWRAAAAMDCQDRNASVMVAMAKKAATDSGFRVANEALQWHGGYGYLHDYGIEKIVRDLRVHQILEGSNEMMQLIIARHFAVGSQ